MVVLVVLAVAPEDIMDVLQVEGTVDPMVVTVVVLVTIMVEMVMVSQHANLVKALQVLLVVQTM